MKVRLLLVFSLFILLITQTVFSGGSINGANGIPIVWDIENRGPIVLTLDRGSLGQFDSAATFEIIRKSIEAWDTIATSSIDIRIGGYFDHDVTSASDPLLSGNTALTDGIIPVVIDDDGSITDAFLGAGARNSVGGFALPITFDDQFFTEGRIILNGINKNRGEVVFTRTATHELGHLFGLSHSQFSMQAQFPIMYPSSGSLSPDDIAAMSILYPAVGFDATVGSISGQIVDVDGIPISGINVMAIDSATGAIYTTITDYYSGGAFGFSRAPTRRGEYHINGLPPGVYYVRFEGVHPDFRAGSRVASYDPPINTEVIREWYDGDDESGAMLLDDVNQRVGLNVGAGESVEGVDFVQNDTVGLHVLQNYQGLGARTYGVPQNFQGVRSLAYAVRFVAPESGAPALVRFRVGRFPSLPDGGEVLVTVHRNRRTQEGDVPGGVVSSIAISYANIAANQDNDVWLFGMTPSPNFSKGDIFHVGLSVNGSGRLDLAFDDSDDGTSTSYLQASDSTWQKFPVEGNNGGMRNGQLKMRLLYSALPAGILRAVPRFSPDPLFFDPTEVSGSQTRSLTIRNIGTIPMEVDQMTISGTDGDAFSVAGSTVLPFSILPGASQEVELIFSPDSEGEKRASLDIQGNTTASVSLQGLGTAPFIGSLATSIDFGQRVLNTTSQIDTQVIYHRGENIFTATVKEKGDGASGFQLIKPTQTVFFRPGDSLQVILEFEPTEEQDYETILAIGFSPDRDTVKIPVVGKGVLEISDVPVIVSASQRLELKPIQPNPVRDKAEITVLYNGVDVLPATFVLVDMEGRILWQEDVEVDGLSSTPFRHMVDMKRYPSAIYHLLLQTSLGVVSRPVMVVR